MKAKIVGHLLTLLIVLGFLGFLVLIFYIEIERKHFIMIANITLLIVLGFLLIKFYISLYNQITDKFMKWQNSKKK